MKGTFILAISMALLIVSLACGQTLSDELSSPVPLPTSPVSALTSVPFSPSATPPPSPTPRPTATPVPTPTPGILGDYTLSQLEMWRVQLSSAIWAIPEMNTSDVNERINQIEYGIDCEKNRDRVQRQIHEILSQENIPVDAVRVSVRGGAQIGPGEYGCAAREVIDPVTGVSSPGFGGLFYEKETSGSWTLNIYMLEPSQKGAEELAFEVVGRDVLEDPFLGPDEIRAVQGQHTWEQLIDWYHLMKTSDIGVKGARLTPDFMEDRNRLIFEVNRERNPDVEAELGDALERLGIPLEAVALEE